MPNELCECKRGETVFVVNTNVGDEYMCKWCYDEFLSTIAQDEADQVAKENPNE